MMLGRMARAPRKQPHQRPADETHAGQAARGVIHQIDQQLKLIQDRLADHDRLLAERDRLLAARYALTGEAPTGKSSAARVSQDDIAAYLQEHPGALPAQIAKHLDVPVTNISQHLYRGKDTRFIRRADGWHLRGSSG